MRFIHPVQRRFCHNHIIAACPVVVRHNQHVKICWIQTRILKMNCCHVRTITTSACLERNRHAGHTPTAGDQNTGVIADCADCGDRWGGVLCQRQARHPMAKARQVPQDGMRRHHNIAKVCILVPSHDRGKRQRLIAHTSGTITHTPDRCCRFTQMCLLALLPDPKIRAVHCLPQITCGAWLRQIDGYVDNIWNELI